jgi:alpha-amylase
VCRWRIALAAGGAARLRALFAPELSLSLLAGDDPDRRYEVPGRTLDERARRLISRGAFEGCAELRLVDDWSRLVISLQGGPQQPAMWRFPLETASQSESGFERTYQGSVLAAVWPIDLAPGDSFETQLSLSVEEKPSA